MKVPEGRRPAQIDPHARGVGRVAASLRRARAVVAPRRKTFFGLLVAAIAIFCVAAWPFTRAHLQAVAVLDQVAGQPVPSLVARLSERAVQTEDFSFAIEAAAGQQRVRARLYSPEGRPNAPALVIFHGVHHLGIDEPRLMGFAAAMASCGIRVLTPELPDIKDYHVDESSVRTIGESAKWFAKQTGGPVGVMGLSFSGGLALVAAADPLYHPDFKFVFAVGSQDSMDRVTQYYRTGSDVRPDGTTECCRRMSMGLLYWSMSTSKTLCRGRTGAGAGGASGAFVRGQGGGGGGSLRLNEVQKREALELMDAGLR